MSVQPLVTVVTPSWNSTEFIERTIQSIRNQTYKNIEFIVVDGGSTDGTVEMIKRHADAVTSWISEPDSGMYDAINKGMRQARGEILAYLNSDDFYYPGTLDFVARYFADHPDVDLLYGDLNFVDAYDRVLFRQSYPSFRLQRFRSMRHAAIGQPAAFWRRSLWERVGEFDASLKMASDFDFFIRAGETGRLAHVPSILAAFRMHGSSMTQRQLEVSHAEVAEIHRRYLKPQEKWQDRLHRCTGNLEFKAINVMNWPRRLVTRFRSSA